MFSLSKEGSQCKQEEDREKKRQGDKEKGTRGARIEDRGLEKYANEGKQMENI